MKNFFSLAVAFFMCAFVGNAQANQIQYTELYNPTDIYMNAVAGTLGPNGEIGVATITWTFVSISFEK